MKLRSTEKIKARIFGLDLLRTIAILCVVVSHYAPSSKLVLGGLLGVELFFVLSGFLIGGILFRSINKDGCSKTTLINFWKRRWLRTIPNYIFFLGYDTVSTLITGSLSWKKWLYYPVFLQNFAWPTLPFFQVSWSLAIEEWFYLLYPLVMFSSIFLFRKHIKKQSMELACAICFLILPVGIRLLYFNYNPDPWVRTIVICRLDAMMYGVILAWIQINRVLLWNRLCNAKLMVLSLFVMLAGIYMNVADSFSITSIVFSYSVIPFATMLAIGPLYVLKVPDSLFKRITSYVSKVSYSAYLLHMPILVISIRVLGDGRLPIELKAVWRIILIVICFALSYLPYLFVEQPFLRFRDKRNLVL